MMMFCTYYNGVASRWYDYPRTVEDFVDMHGPNRRKGAIWCFVENEHVWIVDDSGFYERPDLPEWVLDYNYPEYDD